MVTLIWRSCFLGGVSWDEKKSELDRSKLNADRVSFFAGGSCYDLGDAKNIVDFPQITPRACYPVPASSSHRYAETERDACSDMQSDTLVGAIEWSLDTCEKHSANAALYIVSMTPFR